ncbi:MAG: sensor histidine kinase [Gemmatimonadales bacterium]
MIGGWILQGVVAAQAQGWYLMSAGERVPWRDLSLLAARNSSVWILLSILAIEIARGLDPDRFGKVTIGLAHLVGAAIACSVDVAWDIWLGRLFEFQPWSGKYLALVFRQANGNLFSYGAVVAIYYAVEHGNRSRERLVKASRLESQLTRARLDLLRMQLQPHFLFNTLHGISAVLYDRPKDADRMLTRLGELLRAAANDLGRSTVSLEEELAVLESYLEIERTRFQDRLTVSIDVPADCLDAAVPNLILQPLVENAIKHGVAVHRGTNRIEITARRVGGALSVVVANSGGDHPVDPARFRDGVGLTNTRQRLEEMYRGRHALELRPRHPGGLEVAVRIPYQPIGEAEDPRSDEATALPR